MVPTPLCLQTSGAHSPWWVLSITLTSISSWSLLLLTIYRFYYYTDFSIAVQVKLNVALQEARTCAAVQASAPQLVRFLNEKKETDSMIPTRSLKLTSDLESNSSQPLRLPRGLQVSSVSTQRQHRGSQTYDAGSAWAS